MKPDPQSSTRERILFLLKTRGPHRAAELARRLDITQVAVRQHLQALENTQLVAHESEPRASAGRPARRWSITPAGSQRFPEGYADLSVDLLTAVRDTFGESGLGRLIAERTRKQIAAYRERIPKKGSLAQRVAELARIRREEGYMAEWSRSGPDACRLVENHCPICAAAETCQGLCAGELELFQEVLGPGVSVERSEHMLDGSRRCVYRIAASI